MPDIFGDCVAGGGVLVAASAAALTVGRLTLPVYEMHVANKLWGQVGLEFRADFLSLLDRQYAAPLQRVDFGFFAQRRLTSALRSRRRCLAAS